MDETPDMQRLALLQTMQSQLVAACEQGDKPFVVGNMRDNANRDLQIQIADPCEAVEAIGRQIEAMTSAADGVKK